MRVTSSPVNGEPNIVQYIACSRKWSRSFSALTPASRPLDAERNALAAADTKRGDTSFGVARFHRRQQRHQDARAGGADRVTQRTGAAIDVQIVERNAKLL